MSRKRRSKSAGVTARVLTSTVERNDISRQSEDTDNFGASFDNIILATPYHIPTISGFVDNSNILPQCIEAMVVNTSKFGTRVVAIEEGTDADEKETKVLSSFLKSPNINESMMSVQSGAIEDYERYGFCFYEIIRNARRKPSLIRHAKAFNIRLMRKSGDAVAVTIDVVRGGERSKVTERKKFRKYIQVIGSSKVFYKEFGDPRDMDYRNGRYASKPDGKGGEGYKVDKENRATELLHHRQYSEDSYGLPRWISQLPSILGSRESEEVNLRYFEDNTVPPMIMSVAGGRLTRTSFEDLNRLLKAKGLGKDRQNQILLIEAIPETTGLDEKGTATIKIDKLTSERPSDGLFKEYDDSNINKIRSSFRLPPVVIGMSQDVNFATAQTSMYVAETQVFLPERQTHDEFLNKNFFNHPNGLNLQTVMMESRGPSVTNPDQVVKTLTAVNVMGGVTPRSSIELINETMQLSLPTYPAEGEKGYEEWMDMPIALSIKLMGSAQQTGEGEESEVSGTKTDKIDETEAEGETGASSQAVENGEQ